MDMDDNYEVEVTTFGGTVETSIESPAVDKKVTLESVEIDLEEKKPPVEEEEVKAPPPAHGDDKK